MVYECFYKEHFSRKLLKTKIISENQRQRDFCLDWYAYRIETTKVLRTKSQERERIGFNGLL
tara:strand:- start:235 stop:420 length:186 start_codon:yes stop_codon:yes gene_type:complete